MSFPIVPNILFVVILAIATGYLTFLTTKGSLTDNRKAGGWWSKLTRRGKLVLFILLFICATLICQEVNSQKEDEYKEVLSKRKDQQRDSVIRVSNDSIVALSKDVIIRKLDSSYTSSIKASNEALAKYHLAIVDSMKNVVATSRKLTKDPQLLLAPSKVSHPGPFFTEQVGSGFELKVQFIAKGGNCFNIYVDCYLLEDTSKNFPVLNKINVFDGDNFIVEDVIHTVSFGALNQNLNTWSNKIIGVVFVGRFSKDNEGNFTVPYNQAIAYDLGLNQTVPYAHVFNFLNFRKALRKQGYTL